MSSLRRVEILLEYAITFILGIYSGILHFVRSSLDVHVVKGSGFVEVSRKGKSLLVNIERDPSLLIAAFSGPNLFHAFSSPDCIAGTTARRLFRSYGMSSTTSRLGCRHRPGRRPTTRHDKAAVTIGGRVKVVVIAVDRGFLIGRIARVVVFVTMAVLPRRIQSVVRRLLSSYVGVCFAKIDR